MKQLTLGSLFDGIGGFCYAAGIPSGIDTGCTIKPLWAAEVEPNCIDITRYRFNPKLKFRGCLVTMFYNRDVCRQGEEYLQNQRYPVFRTHIRRTEKADEVTFTTQSLMQYSPRSGAARDYKTFVKEYLEG